MLACYRFTTQRKKERKEERKKERKEGRKNDVVENHFLFLFTANEFKFKLWIFERSALVLELSNIGRKKGILLHSLLFLSSFFYSITMIIIVMRI